MINFVRIFSQSKLKVVVGAAYWPTFIMIYLAIFKERFHFVKFQLHQNLCKKNYHSTLSIQAITFLSLYNILTLTFNSHSIPVKVISKQAAVVVSHPHLLQVISKTGYC